MNESKENRKDPKGRHLRNGETYDAKTGRYRYSYTDAYGKRKQVYSWTLTARDLVPRDKKQRKGESLREKEDAVNIAIANAIDSSGGNMSVYRLLEKFIAIQNPNVRETTRKGYRTQMNFMRDNAMAQSMAKRKIRMVNAMDAEEWMLELHTKEGRSYSSLHTLKGMLKQAFAFAKKSRWVYDNPFDFSMRKKAYGGAKTRDALTRVDMKRFLDFVQTDRHFRRYYDGIYILFNTGLRVSEFCGLTPDDIDFNEHVIHVRRQLLRVWDGKINKLYIEEPKTDNGLRDVPMTSDVEAAFKNVIKSRPQIKETVVWDELHKASATGFLWIDKDGNYEVAQHWSNHLRWARIKFNKIFKDELPPISPHVCRHTFCSNCAGGGMSPKTLQMIMGHSSIEFTLDVYTHMEAGDIKKSFFQFMEANKDDVCHYNRTPDIITPMVDLDEEEGYVDMTEIADDDE